MTIDDFLGRLDHVKSSGKGWSARCPAHEDSQASLTVGTGDDGRILVQCHAGCSAASIVLAAGLDLRDLFPEEQPLPRRERRQKKDPDALRTTEEIRGWQWTRALYVYQHADGRPTFLKVRLAPPDQPKSFGFYRAAGPDQWRKGLDDASRVIYRLPEVVEGVRAGRVIWIAEGEKDVDNLVALGLVATCNPEGASKPPARGKWRHEYSVPFRGANVVICEDNDEAGRNHARDVAEKLAAVVASVRVLSFPELPEKGDVSDWLAAGGTREQLEAMARSAVPWEKPEPPPEDRPHLTDLGNAIRFVRRHGQDVHHVFDFDAWLYWNSNGWAQDKVGYVERAAKETALSMYREAADERIPGREREQLVDWARRSEGAARISAMIKLAASEPGVGVQVDDLDRDPWLYNVENGTIELKTGQIRGPRRQDLITRVAPVTYDPKATCPRWTQFLHEIMLGDEDLIAFLRRATGYSLTGSIAEHCAFFLHGVGRNGKSTFLDVLEHLAGDYATTVPPDLLLETGRPTGGATPELAALKGIRLVVTSELGEGRRLAESRLKALTGGDLISARPMYGHPFTYRPNFSLWVSTNHRPVIRGTDEGIWSRIRLVPFEHVVPEDARDKDLKAKLLAELPGVLNWAIQGCLEWQRIGLAPPAKVRAAVDQYRSDSDVLAAFLDECCQRGRTEEDTAARLYAAYCGWCERAGERSITQRAFGQSLTERGFQALRRAGARYWKGLSVISSSDANDASRPYEHVGSYMHDSRERMETGPDPSHASRYVQEEFVV